MRKFKFNLEVVLRERKRVEDLRLREWTLALQLLQKIIDERDFLKHTLERSISEGDQLAKISSSQVAYFTGVDAFIKGTRLRIEWKDAEIERATKLTERKRLEYVKARQKREVLDKIKQRRIEEFKKAQKKRELKELDDLYTNRPHGTGEFSI